MKALKRSLLAALALVFAFALFSAVAGLGENSKKQTVSAYDAQTDYIDNVGISATINDIVAFDVYLRRTNAVMNQVCMINSAHNKYVGYYKVYLDGSGTNTTGAYSFPNGKGGYTVVLDLTKGSKNGSPTDSTVLNCFRKRGDSGNDSNSDFYVENFRIVNNFSAFTIAASQGGTYRHTINTLTKGTDNAVAVVYKMDADDKYVKFGLGNGNNAWFGYYELYGSVGNTSSYNGVTLRELDSDWVLAIFDLTAMTDKTGAAGNWTDNWPADDSTTFFDRVMAQKSNTGAMTGYVLGYYEELYTVSVTNGTGGNVYLPDENATATVIANDAPDGKGFAGWSNGSSIVSTDEEYTFTVTGDVTLTATYADLYTVSVTGGTVGGESSTEVADGSSVTVVSGTPASGKYFAYWTDQNGKTVSFAPSYTFTVSDDITLTANYDTRDSGVAFTTSSKRYNAASADTYDYVIFDYKLNGAGSRSFRILNSSGDFTGTFTFGTNDSGKVTCYTLENGWVRVICTISGFDDYSTKYSGKGNVYTIYIPSNASGETGSITNIRFIKNYDVGVTGGTGSGTYFSGTSATVVADVDDGYYFRNWTDDSDDSVVSTSASYTFTVTEDVALTANTRAYDGTKVAVGEKVNYNISGSLSDEFTFEYLFEGDAGSAGVCLTNSGTSSIAVQYFTISNGSVGSTSTDGVTITREQLSDGYYKVTVSGAAVATEGMSKIYSNSSHKVANAAVWIRNAQFTEKKLVTVVNGTIGGDSSAYVADGGSATVVAGTPASGKYFAYWTDESGNIVSFAPSYTLTVSDDITLTANYDTRDSGVEFTTGSKRYNADSANTYDYVVFDYKLDGDGSRSFRILNSSGQFTGTFTFGTDDPGKVACHTLENGWVRVICTISGFDDYSTKYSGDGNVDTIYIPSNTSGATGSITNVRFVKNGTVTVTNGTLQNGKTSGLFTGTTTLTVTANEPDSTKYFVGWSDGSSIVSANASYTFEVNGDITLTATYGDKVTVSATGAASGTGLYVPGASVTLVANTPSSTEYFVGWSDGSSIVSTDASYTFTVSDDITLTAVYADKVSVSATGAASGTGLYVPGASATLVANAPSSGYYFAYWTDEEDIIVSFAPSYTFTVSDDITLTANYEADSTDYTFNNGTQIFTEEKNNIIYDYAIFDYQIPDSGNIRFSLWGDYSNFYSWLYYNESGAPSETNSWVTSYALEDGWFRLILDISNAPTPTGDGAFRQIRFHANGTAATAYIRNVRLVKDGTVSVTNGTLNNGKTSGSFTGTTTITVTADAAPVGEVFACWKDGSGNVMSDDEEYTFQVVGNVSLTAYYATLVTVNASGGTVDGESSKTLADGSTVTLVANTPATGYYFLNWTNNAGTEVATTSTAEVTISGATTYTANYLAYSGTKYNSGKSADIDAPKGAKAYDRISFDYKLTANDQTAGFCLLDPDGKYFGYFTINNAGTTSSYDGVFTERLSDGYIRIMLDLDNLTTMNGDLDGDSTIEAIHFSGSRVKADVYVKNVNFLIANEPFAMYPGASVRLKDPYGIRFRALIPFDKYNADATYGMIILPYDYIVNNEINLSGDVKAQLDAKSVKYRIFTCTPIEMDTTDYYIQASLTNILAQNLNREFIGIGFYSVDDEYTYVNNATSCRRTIVGVSESAIKNYELFIGYSSDSREFLLGMSGSDGAAAGAAFSANAFDSIENLKKNDAVSASSTLTLTAAKGESEFGQIVLTATSAVENKAYIIMPNDLTHSDGSTVLSKTNFELFNAYYTNVDSNWINLGNYSYASTLYPGYYVNALVPFYAASASGETCFDRSHGDNQTIFIRFNIPESQKAGIYTGTFRIYVLGVGYKDVSVSFTIADFTLPEENNYKSKYGISPDALSKVFDTDTSKTSDEYVELYEFLLDYNLNGGILPSCTLYYGKDSIDEYIEKLVEYYNNPKVAAIQIAHDSGPAHYEYKKTQYSATQSYDLSSVIYEFDRQLSDSGAACYGTRSALKAIAEYCVENNINLFDKLYYRFNDEPYDAATCIQAILSYNAVKNGVDYALANVNFEGHEDIEASLRNLPYIVTCYPSETVTDDYNATVLALYSGNKLVDSVYSQTAYYPADAKNSEDPITINYKYLTDYVPTYDKVIGSDKDSRANTIRTDSDPNTHLWWYPMITTVNPYPNYCVNTSQIINRSKAWATYYYGIEGELYWSVNSWSELHYTIRPAYENNILDEAAIWNGEALYFGGYEDGTLVYPNATRYKGNFKYCPTYRLVATREGIDDYNYICYAQSLIDGLSAGSYKTAKQSALDGYVASMVNTGAKDAIINNNASTLRTARSNLIALIVELEGHV